MADEVSEKWDGRLTIVDVCPMDIGTDTQGGLMSTILVKGSEFGSSPSKSYVTTSNFQRSMTDRVYKGPRLKASENIGHSTQIGTRSVREGNIFLRVSFELSVHANMPQISRDLSVFSPRNARN